MTNEFVKATIIRAVRTICQTAVATIGSAAVIADVHWGIVVSASLLAGLLSVLTSIARGLPEADYEEYINTDAEEPDDAEILEDEDVDLIMFDEDLDDTEVFEDENEE